MGFFSFLRRQLSTRVPTPENDPSEYVPSFWEDDYCQIEIVPLENIEFIKKQVGQIEDLSAKSRNGDGFTDIFVRGQLPTPTISKEIRVDYLEWRLSSCQLSKAKSIRFDGRKIMDCQTGNTKAFGFPNFTIFFDTEGEFVKNIWIHIGNIVSAPQFDTIQAALHALGEECEVILIDWNSSELFDLADKTRIGKYLMDYWK
ncbi:hypothetical protein Q4E93_22975 [Flavitalea sp. BT771]|uniref:hypothetical protein n=1 Tax=Flavitalea sp. BT771 TaxID=3063329 RepID=UPI0026E24C83|nr:hypothetical protein [Flavitalea sp. BT771]MDO6433495.1 hypothetical protein [Flavitalea sp. BT771]MDV6222600.1 hypothetical protein [Flavitalea sp. BT771]